MAGAGSVTVTHGVEKIPAPWVRITIYGAAKEALPAA